MIKSFEEISSRIRQEIVRVSEKSGTGHISSGLSYTDILSVIMLKYQNAFDSNQSFLHDFVLSKGHGAISYYAALRVFDLISVEEFLSYETNGSKLTTFPTDPFYRGLNFSSGSLGHGLGVLCGLALANKMDGKSNILSFGVLSDGEIQEGSIWEAFMFAGQNKLSNLVVFIDGNKLQAMDKVKDVLDLDFVKAVAELGWQTSVIDGHNFEEIDSTVEKSIKSDKPNLIYANTIKGKGISFMENSLEWHYLGLSGEYLEKAKSEVNL